MEGREFSVSICVYGKDDPNSFDAAINSIIKQTLPPTEIVLTIDGPIPESIESVVNKYKSYLIDSKTSFKTVRLEKNMGHGEARRVCFENCSYPLIALMDADDLSVETRFEKQIDFFLSHDDVSAVGGYIEEFITSEDPLDTTKRAGIRIVPEDDKTIKEYMKKRCPMNQVTVMFRKEDVAEAGGYIDWYCEEDYYLWIRLSLAGKKFGNIPQNLVNVRVGQEMYQRRGGWKYFKSEVKLQKYMLQKKLIRLPRFCINTLERFILQVVLPNKIRGIIFQKLARK